jgi:hypothetical protein
VEGPRLVEYASQEEDRPCHDEDSGQFACFVAVAADYGRFQSRIGSDDVDEEPADSRSDERDV